MTELEYIRATNLAKIRATKNVLRDYQPEDDLDNKGLADVWKVLDRIEQRLTRQVVTKECD